VNVSPTAGAGLAAFVLAGGKSSRMGSDKALLEIAGEPLILRTVRLASTVASSNVRVVGGAQRFAHLAIETIEDDSPDHGPLGGIATALRATAAEWNLILACDLPYLTREWLEFLVARAGNAAHSTDAVVPATRHQNYEPLCAVYRKCCATDAASAVASGHLRVQEFVAALHTAGRLEPVELAEWKRFDSTGRLFKNMNEPGDFDEARRALRERAEP
jgi:molybdopterin-guanine dinucleotide biosynthesis protein A